MIDRRAFIRVGSVADAGNLSRCGPATAERPGNADCLPTTLPCQVVWQEGEVGAILHCPRRRAAAGRIAPYGRDMDLAGRADGIQSPEPTNRNTSKNGTASYTPNIGCRRSLAWVVAGDESPQRKRVN